MPVIPGYQATIDAERERFIASLVTTSDVFVEPPAVCEPCRDLERYALADVLFLGEGFCIAHAYSCAVPQQTALFFRMRALRERYDALKAALAL